MFSIPDPLHPALVHFPIVLILLGTAVGVVSVFLRRWHLPWLAAGLLSAGALGAFAATWSGGNDAEMAGKLASRTEQILEEHEEWGERARNLAIAAALLALASATTMRLSKTSRGLAVAAALVALASSYSVAEAGHYGGLLVYKNGLGVNTAAGANLTPASPGEKARDND
jgi:uncharacterized membrane protein